LRAVSGLEATTAAGQKQLLNFVKIASALGLQRSAGQIGKRPIATFISTSELPFLLLATDERMLLASSAVPWFVENQG
jgi:hypothetical protein